MDYIEDSDKKILFHELLQGWELARQLQINLQEPSSSQETREFMIEKVTATFEKALSMLNWKGGPVVEPSSSQQPSGSGDAIQMPESAPLMRFSRTLLERGGSLPIGHSWQEKRDGITVGETHKRQLAHKEKISESNLKGSWPLFTVSETSDEPSSNGVTSSKSWDFSGPS